MFFGSFLASSEKSLLEELWEYIIETYLTPKYGVYTNITVDRDPLVSPAAIFFAIFFALMAACAVTIFNRRTLGRPVRLLLKHDAIGRKNAKTFAELGLDKPGVLKYFINRLTLSKAIRCVEEDEFYGIPEEYDEEEPEKEEDPDETHATHDYCRSQLKEILREEKRESKRRLSEEKVKEIGTRSRNAHYIAAAAKEKYKRNIETDRFYIEDGMQYRAEIRFSAKGSNPVMLLAIAVGYIIVGVLFIRFLPDMLSFADKAMNSFR